MYAVIAMGGVFAAAAHAPLTAIASVLEMTGNFTLTLPVMLVAGISAALSKRLTYGSIYTTKLLRRGIDIERPRTASILQTLTVADVMHPLADGERGLPLRADKRGAEGRADEDLWVRLAGPITDVREPQALFADEGLEQALRQLVLYGRDGLPVLSHDGGEIQGWITRNNVLRALDERIRSTAREIERGALAADVNAPDPASSVHIPSTPLKDRKLIELTIAPGSAAVGQRLQELSWPGGYHPVAVTDGREIAPPGAGTELRPGDRIILLAPAAEAPDRLKSPRR
jgi:chloride channel protein, CIC family